MIALTGANGITGWVVRTPVGKPRQIVCINDGFVIAWPGHGDAGLRDALAQVKAHSETLNGRTLCVADVEAFN